MGTPITIGGVTFQVSDFEAAANAIIDGIKQGKPASEIVQSLEPALLPVVETLAANFLPGAGAVIAVLAYAYSKSIPFKDLPQAEQNRIQNMQGAGPT